MDEIGIGGHATAWFARTRNWVSERARVRRDIDELSRMDSRELSDLGFSHTAAFGSAITMTECGPIAHRSWIHAQPCFPHRVICQD